MSLNATLREFCIQIIWSSRSLVTREFRVVGNFIFLFFQLLEFLLLHYICKFFSNKIKFLLIKDVNVLLLAFGFIFVEPVVGKNIFSSSSLRWLLLKHQLHNPNCLRTCSFFFELNLLVELLNGVKVANLVSLERHITIEHRV